MSVSDQDVRKAMEQRDADLGAQDAVLAQLDAEPEALRDVFKRRGEGEHADVAIAEHCRSWYAARTEAVRELERGRLAGAVGEVRKALASESGRRSAMFAKLAGRVERHVREHRCTVREALAEVMRPAVGA